MDFYINGEKADISLETEKTIGDVFKSFEIICEENNATVIEISVDGEKVNADMFEKVSEKPIKENTKLEFTVITKNQIFETLKQSAKDFKELSNQMTEIPVAMQNGRSADVHKTIISLADKIEAFCRTSSLASVFDEYTGIKVGEQALKDFFNDFLPILSDFENALKTNDTVGIQDIAEYEIKPRLDSLTETLEGLK